MTFRNLLFALALLVLGGAQAEASESPSLQLIDLTREFDEVWARTSGMKEPARAAAFKGHFAERLPGFYDHRRLGLSSATRYDAHLLKALRAYPEQRAGIRDVSRRFSAMLAPAQRSFEAEFGPMTGYPPIYLVHSLGEFDGGTRTLPEGSRLLFGADMIARLYEGRNPLPFFHHELFHLYHARTFPICQPIWCSLWTEGLATYVASKLNEGASDEELLLSWPAPLRPAVERDRPAAVCSTLKLLNSIDGDDYVALFSNGKPGGGLPSRYGYYVGYLVAAEAGKTRSLQQLAQLGSEEVRPLVEATLRNMASC
jgi:hypothetical protein